MAHKDLTMAPGEGVPVSLVQHTPTGFSNQAGCLHSALPTLGKPTAIPACPEESSLMPSCPLEKPEFLVPSFQFNI